MKRKNISRLLAFILAIVLLIPTLPVNVLAEVTIAEPIVISTQEELTTIAMDGNYILGGDIELTGEWTALGTALGTSSAPFTGTFDGAGYEVSGLSIVAESKTYQGFFGAIGATAIVQNVVVSGKIISTQASNAFIGGIVGSNRGIVKNCINKVVIEGKGKKIGGVVGDSMTGSQIIGCANLATISGQGTLGGVVGAVAGTTITNCYNTGTVTGTNTNCGGVIGYTTGNGTLKNSYNASTVISPKSNVGAVVGFLSGTYSADNCYWEGVTESIGFGNAGGGYEGTITNSIAKSEEELREITATLNADSPEGSAFVADSSNINSGYPILECQMPKVAKYAVQITPSPINATIVVKNASGEKQNGANGLYKLPNGEYSYEVSAFGYVTKNGNFSINNLDMEPINVTLAEADKKKVTFNINIIGAKIVVTHAIDGVQIAEDDGSYVLPAGDYSYTAVAKGYAPKTDGRFSVETEAVTEVVSLTQLEAATPWDGITKTTVTAIGGIYYIQNGAELAWLGAEIDKGNQISSNVVLLQDIDLNSITWESIGDYEKNYIGIFDGNGCIIKNIAGINSSGLFYSLGKQGSIENLTVTGAISGSSNVGGIVGVNYGTLRNCFNAVTISATGQRAGGVVGNNSGNIIGCVNTGIISNSYNSYANTIETGGIAGQNSGTIENNYNVANITATGTNHNGGVGGIVGTNSGSIANTYNTGVVSYTYNPVNGANPQEIDKSTGALAGISNGNIQNSLYLNGSCTKAIGAGTGGIDGAVVNTSEELMSRSSVLNLNGGSIEGPFYMAENSQQNGGYPVLKWQGGKAPIASPDETSVAIDKTDLVLTQLVYVEAGTIALLNKGKQGSDITWSSNNTGIISNNGSITLPLEGSADIILTATLTKGSVIDTKAFTIRVYSKKQTTLNYLAEAKTALGNGLLVPVYGKDTNVVSMVQAKLNDSGFSSVTVALTNNGATGMGDDTYINANGDITYFYRDPSSGTGNSGTTNGMAFSLTKSGESIVWDNVRANIYWDRAKVVEQLNLIADKLIWDEIKGSNTDSSQITLPISLPLKIDNKGWATITWETDAEDILYIPIPNPGSETPLTTSINRPQVDTALNIKATVSFNLTNSTIGGELKITVERILPLVVKGNGVDNKVQMQENLNKYYTIDKIKDTITSEAINPEQVAGDIQIITPRNTGIPDSSAYSFTATSKDTDILIFNGYRGIVYRPLPTEEAVTVGFTVTMTSRANKALSVSKDFEIKVLPLTKQEIDDGIRLMEAVRDDYHNAILGDGNTQNAITQNMSTFNEAIFDSDGKTLKYSRALKDDTDRGIMVDDLVGSEPGGPGYEKWRTFKSSRPDLILHELLRLEAKPTYDTTVTITSSLTHEVLGKYAKKHTENKDLQSLYQIEVKSVVTVKGSSEGPNPNPDPTFNASFSLDGKNYIENINETTISGLKEGSTAFDILERVFTSKGFTYQGSGRYINAVIDSKGKKIGEFEKGPNSGWMYHVNGTYTSKMLDEYYLSGNEKIHLYYVDDFTTQPGNPVGDSEQTNTNKTEKKDGETILKPSVIIDKNGNAKVDITEKDIDTAIASVKKDNTTSIIIAPEVNGVSSKISVELKKTSIAAIGNDTKAGLKVETSIGSISLSNTTLISLAKESGNAISIAVEQNKDKSISLNIAIDGKEYNNIPGGISVNIPIVKATSGMILTLIDKDGKEIIVKKSIANEKSMTALINGSAIVKVKDNTKILSDMEKTHWAIDAVNFATSHELFNGTSNTEFSPNKEMTRAMLITVLHRLENNAKTNTNIEGSWYDDAVAWGDEAGIISSNGIAFNPDDAITREALATMIYRYAKTIEMDIKYDEKTIDTFTDSSTVSAWAREAMKWCVEKKIFTGKNENTLDPTGNASRAEVASILQRLLNEMLK